MERQLPEDLTDEELLLAVVAIGDETVRACRVRQADAGEIHDDPRWTLSPIPLAFEAQLHVLLLGALDAYSLAAALLRDRASQQVFSMIRFQMETLTLVRWMAESSDPRERQGRAYRVLWGQLSRWSKILALDAAKGPAEAQAVADRAEAAKDQIIQLAREDGYRLPRDPPGRTHLFQNYLPEGGYETFAMYSELGSHPGMMGNLLFALDEESEGGISFNLGGAFGQRAFWAGAALLFLHLTVREMAAALGWEGWLRQQIVPLVERSRPYLAEAASRKGRRAQGGSP